MFLVGVAADIVAARDAQLFQFGKVLILDLYIRAVHFFERKVVTANEHAVKCTVNVGFYCPKAACGCGTEGCKRVFGGYRGKAAVRQKQRLFTVKKLIVSDLHVI